MDSLRGTQGVAGAYSWGVTGTPAKPSVAPQGEPLSVGLPLQDQLDLSGLPTEIDAPARLPVGVPVELPIQLPSIEVPLAKPTLGPQVPMFLAGDQFDLAVGTASSAPAGPSTVAGLGIMAQIDEPSAASGVRAIDNQPRLNPFSDFHMVGPGNAQQFLGNPGALYLGM